MNREKRIEAVAQAICDRVNVQRVGYAVPRELWSYTQEATAAVDCMDKLNGPLLDAGIGLVDVLPEVADVGVFPAAVPFERFCKVLAESRGIE